MKTLLLLLLIPLAFLEAADLRPPLLGYSTETESSIVRLMGVPGAAVAARVATPHGVSRLALAPAQSYGLSLGAACARIVDLEEDSVRELEEVPGNARLLSYSPQGRAALLLDPVTGELLLVTALNAAAPSVRRVSNPVPDASWTGVSDDAQQLAVLTSNALYRLSSNGTLFMLRASERGAVAAFSPGSHVILLALPSQRRVESLDSEGKVIASWENVTAESIVGAPTGAAVVAAGKTIHVLPAEGAIQTMEAPLANPIVAPLSQPGLFQVGSEEGGPVWLLDVGGEEPRLVFVPREQREGGAK